MFWRSIMAPVVALLIATTFVCTASAQPRDRDFDRGPGPGRGDNWQLLGSTRVGGFGVDRDVIDVGRREGQFENIALQARGGAANIIEVSVIYGNNDAQRIDIRRTLRDGERSPPLNLQGRGRAIKSIMILPRSWAGRAIAPCSTSTARSAATAIPGSCSASSQVGFGVDRDVIRVGRHEGRFEKIALEVRDNDVEILDLTVFFHRGPPQDLQRARVHPRGWPHATDRSRRRRSLDRSHRAHLSLAAWVPRPRQGRRVRPAGTSGPPPPPAPGPPPPMRRRSGRSSAAARPASCRTRTRSASGAAKDASAPSSCASPATRCTSSTCASSTSADRPTTSRCARRSAKAARRDRSICAANVAPSIAGRARLPRAARTSRASARVCVFGRP